MDKFSFIALWDAYRGLLTPTQQEITDLYFNMDLTVSEIAAEKGITRQAVSECMRLCKKQLEEYEEKLGFAERYSAISTQALRWADEFKTNHPELSDEADKLVNIFQKADKEA